MYAFFFDLAEFCKGKHLESAGVRQDRTLPVHKLVKSSKLLHNLVTRTYMEMISIGKLHLCSDLIKILRRNSSLDCPDRTHIHKHRSLDRTMHSLKLSPLRTPLRFH